MPFPAQGLFRNSPRSDPCRSLGAGSRVPGAASSASATAASLLLRAFCHAGSRPAGMPGCTISITRSPSLTFLFVPFSPNTHTRTQAADSRAVLRARLRGRTDTSPASSGHAAPGLRPADPSVPIAAAASGPLGSSPGPDCKKSTFCEGGAQVEGFVVGGLTSGRREGQRRCGDAATGPPSRRAAATPPPGTAKPGRPRPARAPPPPRRAPQRGARRSRGRREGGGQRPARAAAPEPARGECGTSASGGGRAGGRGAGRRGERRGETSRPDARGRGGAARLPLLPLRSPRRPSPRAALPAARRVHRASEGMCGGRGWSCRRHRRRRASGVLMPVTSQDAGSSGRSPRALGRFARPSPRSDWIKWGARRWPTWDSLAVAGGLGNHGLLQRQVHAYLYLWHATGK